MSILQDPPLLPRRTSTLNSALWFTAYVLTAIVGGAVLGGWLIPMGLEADSGLWHDLLEDHGAPRVLRRLQTLLAVLLAPWMLKNIGWQGKNDLGWNSAQPRSKRRSDFWVWFCVGTAVMSAIFGTSILLGVRMWREVTVSALMISFITSFTIRGIGVGIIEETLTRGVLYRSLARAWTPWCAAVISSIVFAWAHFMKADPESFRSGIGAVVGSSLFSDFSTAAVPVKFLNMFLLGLVFCRLVHGRDDIWAAVGLHASAVGAIKFFSSCTEFDREVPYQLWIGGHSSKFDDGLLLTGVLMMLLIVIESRRDQPSSTGFSRSEDS